MSSNDNNDNIDNTDNTDNMYNDDNTCDVFGQNNVGSLLFHSPSDIA